MVDRFRRDIKIVAGPLTIEPRTAEGYRQPMLAVEFDILKTNNRESNKAELVLFNLKAESRSHLQVENQEVIIEAGYVDEIVQIFKGDIVKTTIGRDNVDWITTLELGDGVAAQKSARINSSFRGGQPVGQMLKQAADALGLDVGNLDEKVSANGARSVLSEFVNGFVLSGKADDVVDELASSLGLNYSVQDKTLQFLAKGEALQDPPVQLNAATGLIGSPSVGEKGIVKAESLLNGLYKPGRKVELESLLVSGTFIAQKVRHVGATWGSNWTTSLEMSPLA